jgi:hypothetical protein
MKLQRLVNRKVGDKTYHKWILNIPPALVEELGWTDQTELVAETDEGRLVIRKST